MQSDRIATDHQWCSDDVYARRTQDLAEGVEVGGNPAATTSRKRTRREPERWGYSSLGHHEVMSSDDDDGGDFQSDDDY